MAKKKVKVHTEDEYLFNPIREMIEDHDDLSELPGCCGVSVLEGFPGNDAARQIADEANRIERENADSDNLGWPHEYIEEPVTRKEILNMLFAEAPLTLATTIPSQKYAIKALEALGFVPLETFMGRNRNRITLWSLKQGIKRG